MIPTELRCEFIKQNINSLTKAGITYTLVTMYTCKHCNKTTAHPELYDEFPSVCSAKDRRITTRRQIDKDKDNEQ